MDTSCVFCPHHLRRLVHRHVRYRVGCMAVLQDAGAKAMITYEQARDTTDLQALRERISHLYVLKRETEWRGEAYRCMVEIEDLKKRQKKLREHAKQRAAFRGESNG